jgi:hypothetical protein
MPDAVGIAGGALAIGWLVGAGMLDGGATDGVAVAIEGAAAMGVGSLGLSNNRTATIAIDTAPKRNRAGRYEVTSSSRS